VQHIAGSENDCLAALRVKSQWESLLGLDDSGEGSVFDAGSLASKQALYGTCGKVRRDSKEDRVLWWRCTLRRWARGVKRRYHRHRSEVPRVWVDKYYPVREIDDP
jgi:hypothetical protein